MKEIPEPTEKSMLVKLLLSLNEKYELAGSTIEVRVNEVRATFRFPEQNLPKLREIANNIHRARSWASSETVGRQCIVAKSAAGS